MAKSRRREAAGGTEFGNLVDLDVERRAARRAKKAAEHGEREETKQKNWQEELVKKGGTERERRAQIAALYSDLRESYDKGSLTKEEIQKYLEDFPSEAEREAYKKISEAIKSGEISEEVRGVKGRAADEPARDKKRREVKQRIREIVGGKWVDREARVPVERARPGIVGKPTAEEKSEWSAEDWYRFLLREYATGQFGEDEIENFFEDFSSESKEAHKKLLKEIRVEKKPENKLSREEVEEMLMRGLGVREELIKDIPTEEGKTLFEEMLDDQIEIFKGMLLDTVSREDIERKIQEVKDTKGKIPIFTPAEIEKMDKGKKIGGTAKAEFLKRWEEAKSSGEYDKLAKEIAEREIIVTEAKKFLAVRELFTHGVMGYDKKNGRIVLNRYSDLDGKVAMTLLGKAGLDISKVGYLTPGEIKQGQVTFDSGNRDGLVAETAETVDPETGERRIVISTIFDHHGPHSDRGTSATKNIYKVFTELGLLKFKDEEERQDYGKVVDWVTRSDNFNFPGTEKYFETSDRRMIGFVKFLNFSQLLNFARSGKELTSLLSPQELREFGLIYKEKKTGKVVDHAAERREVIKKTLETVRDLISKGWTVITKDSKRFLVDTQSKIGGEGQWAAESLGYDGVIRYTPETHNFFVALNKGTFDKKTFEGLPQGKLVRGSVFIQLPGQEKLTVTLGDLFGRLAPDFNPGPKTELKRFLDTEPRRIRAIVSQSPEGWWWTNTPDGKKVIVKSVPKNFKSGQELYVALREPDEIDRKRYGMQDFYTGFFESDEIFLPKKVEAEAPVEAEAKPEAPEAPPEKELSPPERERQEKEKKLTEAVAAEEQKLFHEFLQKLEGSEFYGKWDIKRRENFARAKIKPRVEDAKKKLRKKYGL
jgi:hypothetical protein